MISAANPTPLRRAINSMRAALLPLWRELRRLNALGLRGDDVNRTKRSAAFRAALSEKYRDRSPCC